jgi:hypothetical protein
VVERHGQIQAGDDVPHGNTAVTQAVAKGNYGNHHPRPVDTMPVGNDPLPRTGLSAAGSQKQVVL